MLKPARGTIPSSPIPPLPINQDWELQLQPAKVLDHRWLYAHNKSTLELLVSWDSRPTEEATWEDYDLLVGQFPHFRLEDKSFYRQGSSDTTPTPLKVYSRRGRNKSSSNKDGLELNVLEQLDLIYGAGFDPFHPLRETGKLTGVSGAEKKEEIEGNMGQTRSEGSGSVPEPTVGQVANQLTAIMSKLELMESWKEDLTNLKRQFENKEKSGPSGTRYDDGESSFNTSNRRPFHKIDFPTFSGGDPRGWILKAEKYFRFYNTSEEEKVDIAAMHLEDDALDLYSWLSSEQAIAYWDELTLAFQKHYGPPEFQNPDEYLISVRQTGSVHDYRQEFARHASRVTNWPDHCLLGVFLHGLKEELKSDVRIHKPRTVYKAVSLALEFESKLTTLKPTKYSQNTLKPEAKPFTPTSYPTNTSSKPETKPSPRISDPEKQARFLRGECFRCGDKYGPGHRCKIGTFKLLEAEEETEKNPVLEEREVEENPEEMAEISLHAIFGKFHTTTMKIHGMLNSTEVLILTDSGSTHND